METISQGALVPGGTCPGGSSHDTIDMFETKTKKKYRSLISNLELKMGSGHNSQLPIVDP